MKSSSVASPQLVVNLSSLTGDGASAVNMSYDRTAVGAWKQLREKIKTSIQEVESLMQLSETLETALANVQTQIQNFSTGENEILKRMR